MFCAVLPLLAAPLTSGAVGNSLPGWPTDASDAAYFNCLDRVLSDLTYVKGYLDTKPKESYESTRIKLSEAIKIVGAQKDSALLHGVKSAARVPPGPDSKDPAKALKDAASTLQDQEKAPPTDISVEPLAHKLTELQETFNEDVTQENKRRSSLSWVFLFIAAACSLISIGLLGWKKISPWRASRKEGNPSSNPIAAVAGDLQTETKNVKALEQKCKELVEALKKEYEDASQEIIELQEKYKSEVLRRERAEQARAKLIEEQDETVDGLPSREPPPGPPVETSTQKLQEITAKLIGERWDDLLRDFNDAREDGSEQTQTVFKERYAPCLPVKCTNLTQRGISGVQFTFSESALSSFLTATGKDGLICLLPKFSLEYLSARTLLEGPFRYPEGESEQLRLTRPGILSLTAEGWQLDELGVFSA